MFELSNDPQELAKPWHMVNSDCITHMATLPDACMDMALFSPPFPQMYSYGAKQEDIGNSESVPDMKLHLSFFYRQLTRIIKPGRVVMVHVAQIPRMKRTGESGMFDFRGFNIRLSERAGLVFEYDWCVRKNPQAQALRSRSRELQFAGLESDRAKSRGAMPDYLLKFRVPGNNAVPVDSEDEVTRNEWIKWAECCWDDIRETDTLNTKAAKSGDDLRHICALQLPVIDRLVRLYTNPGELVCSPFAGIGSEGHAAILRGRRFYGMELKEEYFAQAKKNLASAVRRFDTQNRGLFDSIPDDAESEALK